MIDYHFKQQYVSQQGIKPSIQSRKSNESSQNKNHFKPGGDRDSCDEEEIFDTPSDQKGKKKWQEYQPHKNSISPNKSLKGRSDTQSFENYHLKDSSQNGFFKYLERRNQSSEKISNENSASRRTSNHNPLLNMSLGNIVNQNSAFIQRSSNSINFSNGCPPPYNQDNIRFSVSGQGGYENNQFAQQYMQQSNNNQYTNNNNNNQIQQYLTMQNSHQNQILSNNNLVSTPVSHHHNSNSLLQQQQIQQFQLDTPNNSSSWGNRRNSQNQFQDSRQKLSQNKFDNTVIHQSKRLSDLSLGEDKFGKQSTDYAYKNQSILENALNELPFLKQSQYAQISTKTEKPAITKAEQDSICDKLIASEQIKRAKIEKMADEKLKKELSECTFAPSVNKYGSRRSSNEFCEFQNQFIQYTEHKKSIAREQTQQFKMVEVTGKPSILNKSKKLLENKSLNEVPAFVRLYSLHKRNSSKEQLERESSNENNRRQSISNEKVNKYYQNKGGREESARRRELETNTFTPAIQSRSKSLKRNEKVEDILYKDAQRRNAKAKQSPKKNLQGPKTLLKSEDILTKKFIREFQIACQELKIDDNFSVKQMFALIHKLGFVHSFSSFNQGTSTESTLVTEEKMGFLLWSLAGGKEFKCVLKINLISLLLFILGLNIYSESEKLHSLLNEGQRQHSLTSQNNPLGTYQTQQNNLFTQFSSAATQNTQQSQTFNNQNIQTSKISEKILTIPINQRVSTVSSKVASQMKMDETSYVNTLTNENYLNILEQSEGDNCQIQRVEYKNESKATNNKQTNQESDSQFMLTTNQFQTTQTQCKSQTNEIITQQQQQQANEEFNEDFQIPEFGIELGSFDPSTRIWISEIEDRKAIHQAFDVFYRNRLAYEELKKNKKDWEYPFEPQLEPKSETLAQKNREKVLYEASLMLDTNQISMKIPKNGKITHSQLLMLQNMVQQSKMNLKKSIKEDEDFKECTFTPKILKEHFNFNAPRQICNSNNQTATKISRANDKSDEKLRVSSKSKDKKTKTTGEILEEKSFDLCTFQPELFKPLNSSNQQNQVKNSQKSIERLRNAQKLREQKNEYLSRGYNKVNEANFKKQQKYAFQSSSQSSSIMPLSTKNLNVQQNNNHSNITPVTNKQEQKSQFKQVQSQYQFYQQQKSSKQQQHQQQPQQQQHFSQQQKQQQQHQHFVGPIKNDEIITPYENDQHNKFQFLDSQNNQYKLESSIEERGSGNTNDVNDFQGSNSMSQNNDPVPLLFVDVNLGMGKTERITVYEGDKSEELASKFAAVHNLDEETKNKFKDLLDSQIAGLLSLIEEEEMLSHESELNSKENRQQNS